MTLTAVSNGVPMFERSVAVYHQRGTKTQSVVKWQGTYKWKRIHDWQLGLIECSAYQHRGNGHFRIDLVKYETKGEHGGPGSFTTWQYKSTNGFERAWEVIEQNVLAHLVTHGANWATSEIKTTRYRDE